MPPELANIPPAAITWPVAVVILAYILREPLIALLFKMAGKVDASVGTRISGLEKFQAEAEGNHFTDLDRVIEDVAALRKDFTDHALKIENRLTTVETKLFNGPWPK